MRAYLDLVERVLTHGRRRTTGTQGIANIVYTGDMMRFRPAEEFPLLTTKDLGKKAWKAWRALKAELLWFLSGSTHIRDLHKNDVHLWDQWATREICDRYGLPEGELGRIYGKQWRSWRTSEGGNIDQISNLVREIKEDPNSKRMMVTSWNPEDVNSVMVAPCHGIFKCVVAEGIIDLMMCQRSADLPVGVPFNIASYSLLLLMLAQVTGLKPGELIYAPIDIHIYEDQIEGIKTQMAREPRKLPKLRMNPEVKNIFGFSIEDFALENYDPHPFIKLPVAL